MKNLDRIRKQLSPERSRKISARASEIMAEEMTRKQLRRALSLTQVALAKNLGITQDGLSRLENRTDLLLSTLRGYVQAMGGKLELVVEFPDRKIILSGIAEATPEQKSAGRKRVHAHA